MSPQTSFLAGFAAALVIVLVCALVMQRVEA